MNFCRELNFYLALALSCAACTQNIQESITDAGDANRPFISDLVDSGENVPNAADAGLPCVSPISGYVDDLVSGVNEVEVVVNLNDGFMSVFSEERYLLRLLDEGGYLFYNTGDAVTVSGEQVNAIMDAIGESWFYFNRR